MRIVGRMMATILILEDDPFIALDLEAIAGDVGVEAIASRSVREALQAIETCRIDAALLDIDVTDGKSFPLALALAERRIPFAFVSGSRPAELPYDLSAAPFIPKPFDPRTVRRTLKETLLEAA